MIDTVEFGERKIPFNTNFAWCFIYKSQFGKDPEKVILPAAQLFDEQQTKMPADTDEAREKQNAEFTYKLYDILGFTEIVNISWAMAKLADKSLPEPIEWVQNIGDDFDPSKLLQEVIPDAIISCFTSKKSKVPTPTGTAGKKAPKKSASN